MMTHLSLFSGIGGLDLAAEWAGFHTVGQCEWADYPRAVLGKHWPGLPRWRDIRTLTKESFYEQTGLRTVDIISGGFPCQPFSVAGKQRGKEDDRYLWPEMLRVIQEIGPRWVIGENVAGIVTLALDTVLSDLENIGYTCQAVIIPACAVDAPHRRDRVAIVSYSNGAGLQTSGAKQQAAGPPGVCEDVANTDSFMRAEPMRSRERRAGFSHESWWPAEPDVGRVAYGVPNRVDRLKCLGNAVVPQQFYPIFAAIAEIERSGGNG
jgi:DNA (cytosine-5)-methyltransferase 1